MCPKHVEEHNYRNKILYIKLESEVNYIRKVSLRAVAGGMSKVESDEHYRVKPAYNGT